MTDGLHGSIKGHRHSNRLALHVQGREVWEALGEWVTEAKPNLGSGTKQRFEMASKLQPDEVTQASGSRSLADAAQKASPDIWCLPAWEAGRVLCAKAALSYIDNSGACLILAAQESHKDAPRNCGQAEHLSWRCR